VLANLGTNVNRRERTARVNKDVMVNVGMEGSNEGDGVHLKISDTGE